MKSAKEARTQSQSNIDKKTSDAKILMTHLETEINKASAAGQFSLQPMTFPVSQISQDIINTAETALKALGYKVAVTHNNAQQTNVIVVSW
jgi:hypothetical protein